MVGKGRDIPNEVNKKSNDKTDDSLMRDVQMEREKQAKGDKSDKVSHKWKQKEILQEKVVAPVVNSSVGQNVQTARTVLMGPNVEQYCKDGAMACLAWAQQVADKGGYGETMQMFLSQTAPANDQSGGAGGGQNPNEGSVSGSGSESV